MATDRRQQVLLGALLVVLAVVGYRAWTQTSAVPARTSNSQGTRRPAAPAGREPPAVTTGAPDVHLEALDGQRQQPDRAERNLFRFKEKAAPPPPPDRTAVAAPPRVSTGPPAPAPPPPISLKCIGVFDRGQGQKIAILTDGVGPPMYAAEGQTVAGRYRILRIGVESIEMAYLDGRGRQTIRISGS